MQKEKIFWISSKHVKNLHVKHQINWIRFLLFFLFCYSNVTLLIRWQLVTLSTKEKMRVFLQIFRFRRKNEKKKISLPVGLCFHPSRFQFHLCTVWWAVSAPSACPWPTSLQLQGPPLLTLCDYACAPRTKGTTGERQNKIINNILFWNLTWKTSKTVLHQSPLLVKKTVKNHTKKYESNKISAIQFAFQFFENQAKQNRN